MKGARVLVVTVSVLFLTTLIACGGGGGGSGIPSSTPSNPQPQPLTITTSTPLPGTLQGYNYSVTLAATGGQAPYQWSIGEIDAFHPMIADGLSLDPNTGVISGIPTFVGTGQFLATVTDSSSPTRTATKGFTFEVRTALSVPETQNASTGQFQQTSILLSGVSGGILPFYFALDDGACLPPGMKSIGSTQNGGSLTVMVGTPLTAGTYQCRVTVRDSFTPPETGTVLVTVLVTPPHVAVADSLPSKLLLNRPFSGRVIASGGLPPYSYQVVSGSLPPGLGSLEATTGRVSGTPTVEGDNFFSIQVSDSSSTPQSATRSFVMHVLPAKGRNDTPATATAIGNGSFLGSISPYIDPPDGTPAPGDNDYYKLVSLGGATVHVETFANHYMSANTLDSVIEIVDGNGHQLSACRQPPYTSINFNSPCINDDIGGSPYVQDSGLDFKVPGEANTATTFYVHVFDWRGDSRPDMTYQLNVSGVLAPLAITTESLAPAARGLSYSQNLSSANGNGTVSWAVDSGALPPGLSLNANGSLSGTATTNGTYTFTVSATDSTNPPQAATKEFTIEVVDPVTITSPAVWPDACVNQPYTFTVQTSGGAPPVRWGFQSFSWPGINMQWPPGQPYPTGVFSGTSNITGTFTGQLSATDATDHTDRQQVTLTVKTCP